MKWNFLKKLPFARSSGDKRSSKNSSGRYRKARFVDLMCTLKRRRHLGGSVTSCFQSSVSVDSCHFRDHFTQLLEKSSVRTDSKYSSFDRSRKRLWLKLRRGSCKQCPQPTNGFREAQPAFCPTCRNVVILLPQKRQSATETPRFKAPAAKRKRTCVMDEPPEGVCWLLDDSSKAPEHFNPIYDSIDSESDATTYCSVAEEKELFVQRRSYRDTVGLRLQRWLDHSSQTSFSSVEASETLSSHIYSTIAAKEPSLADFYQGQWVSSTLKRSRVDDADSATVYDEVASEANAEASCYIEAKQRPSAVGGKDRCKLRRQLSGSQDRMSAQVKRIRREYFVCEE